MISPYTFMAYPQNMLKMSYRCMPHLWDLHLCWYWDPQIPVLPGKVAVGHQQDEGAAMHLCGFSILFYRSHKNLATSWYILHLDTAAKGGTASRDPYSGNRCRSQSRDPQPLNLYCLFCGHAINVQGRNTPLKLYTNLAFLLLINHNCQCHIFCFRTYWVFII